MTGEQERAHLPQSWTYTTLEELCNKITDGTHRTPKYVSEGVPFISTTNIVPFKKDFDFSQYKKFISRKEHEELVKRSNPAKGDILVSKCGTIGRAQVVNVDYDFSIFVGLALLKLRNQVVFSKFLEYWLNYHGTKKRLEEVALGSTRRTLTINAINRVGVPLPPLPEQNRIVDRVEELFARLDAGVEGLRKVKTQLKRYRQAVLKYAFEGKLTEEWRKTHKDQIEPAFSLLQCILKNRRLKWEPNHFAQMKDKGMTSKDDRWAKKYKEPISPDTSDLPRLPDEWIWVTLDQLAWSVKDGPHYSPEYSDQGIPFITGGNVRPSGVDFDSAKRISPELHRKYSERCKPEIGDILYTKGGTTGVARVNTYSHEFSVWVHVAVLKLAGPLEPFYVQHALNSPFCHEQAQRFTHGVGNQDLGLTRMTRIVLSLPPLAEQKKIIAEIDHLQSITDEVERIVETNLGYAEHLRQTILRDAFLGKLVPQDPDDEGADKLLERIKAERAKSKGEKDTNKGRKNKPKQSELPNYVK